MLDLSYLLSPLGEVSLLFVHSFRTVPASQRQGYGKLEREVKLFGVCLYKNGLL